MRAGTPPLAVPSAGPAAPRRPHPPAREHRWQRRRRGVIFETPPRTCRAPPSSARRGGAFITLESPMPLREFTDADHRTWQVWDTVPKSAEEDQYFVQNARMIREVERAARRAGEEPERPSHLPPRFTEGREHGWLTFMRDDEKRRLSPIPERWVELDDEGLSRLLARADRVARTTGFGL